ncbi:hypothetical protein TIFTF001_014061 [Ficus carica]|uniref:CCHC-type domain-containing protein n=1 Tax=Ficus carica TaxID=3494 RepID=A0AA88D599_FICCA|nr:hypothetical protein TIFTF001_014061 [Ficus carica]
MDEMLGRLSSFSITEEEASVIGIPDEVIEKGRKEASFGLMGEVLSSKPFNKGSVMSTMIKLWAADGDLSAQVIDRDIFLFSFKKEQDRARVLAMEPWSFNKSLMLLKTVNGDETLRWDSWNLTCFWIRVYNLPYDGMIREIGEKFGNGIGRFLDVITDKNGRCPGMYMRLRVQIDVSRPLRRGAMVQLGSNGAKVWTSFKYERVPDFCFGCGRIGHGRLECVDDKIRNANSSEQMAYNSDLRADLRSERSRGSGNAGGSKWTGSNGLGEQPSGTGNVGGDLRGNRSRRSCVQGGPLMAGPGSQKLPTVNNHARLAENCQDPLFEQSPESGEPDLTTLLTLKRDLGAEIVGHNESRFAEFPNSGITLEEEASLPSHVSGTTHLNETVSFDKSSCIGDAHVLSSSHVTPPSHVTSSSQMANGDMQNMGGLHGTVHGEERKVDGPAFSAGVVEPAKRTTGKWKKAARLTGASGVGSSPALVSVNVKRKIALEVADGTISKSRKIEGLFLEAVDSAVAADQPRRVQ